MHLFVSLRLSAIPAILAALCILSSANPTSPTVTKDTADDNNSNALSVPLRSLPATPQIQILSKRSGISTYWGNGWAFRTTTYSALLPILPAATRLSIVYARILRLSSAFPPNLVASTPAIYNGMRGQMVRFQCGGLEMRFFSVNSFIPWNFVAAVAQRMGQDAAMGLTGLYGTVYTHQGTGLVVFVTLLAVGVPVPPLGVLVPRVG